MQKILKKPLGVPKLTNRLAGVHRTSMKSGTAALVLSSLVLTTVGLQISAHTLCTYLVTIYFIYLVTILVNHPHPTMKKPTSSLVTSFR